MSGPKGWLIGRKARQGGLYLKVAIIFKRRWDLVTIIGNITHFGWATCITLLLPHSLPKMIARRYANRYLDPEKTIKDQDKLAVTLLLTYVSDLGSLSRIYATLVCLYWVLPLVFVHIFLLTHLGPAKTCILGQISWQLAIQRLSRHLPPKSRPVFKKARSRWRGEFTSDKSTLVRNWSNTCTQMDDFSDDALDDILNDEDELSPRPWKDSKCLQVRGLYTQFERCYYLTTAEMAPHGWQWNQGWNESSTPKNGEMCAGEHQDSAWAIYPMVLISNHCRNGTTWTQTTMELRMRRVLDHEKRLSVCR